ncbi:WD40 repeat domain-containing protein [bacterium]|nr:WD40 repeat domain-containing protein [bacterium]
MKTLDGELRCLVLVAMILPLVHSVGLCGGEQLDMAGARGDETTVVAISADGRLFATGGKSGSVELWDSRTQRHRQILTGHTAAVSSLTFSRDGRHLASGSFDRSIRLWHVDSGGLVRTFDGHPRPVKSLTFSEEGALLASSGADGTRLWDVASGSLLRAISSPRGVPVVALSPDGSTIASAGHTVTLFSTRTGGLLRELPSADDELILALDFSKDGRLLAGGGTGKTVRVWETATGTQTRTLENGDDFIRSVAFITDDTSMVVADRTAVRAWDLETGEIETWHDGGAYQLVSLSSDGGFLVAARADGSHETISLDGIR